MLALPMLAGAQRRVMGVFALPPESPYPPLRRSTIYTRAKCTQTRLTLQNYFYSILHSFLNLEIANNFIPEEDYKLRAAMYDVEPRAPR